MSQGSVEEFKANWQRPEAEYCHFTRGEPVNQIQFAFRQNWLEFAKIMEPLKPWAGRKALEVGAGRGTMSMYFADNGFDVSLLDACESPLCQAHKAFRDKRMECNTFVGDAMKMPFEDESFDVVHSYGLMEHFEDINSPLREQARVLKQGGCLIAYVVPSEPNKNMLWADLFSEFKYGHEMAKDLVYRNDYSPEAYQWDFEVRGLKDGYFRHVYPYPMIGPSSDFPFTLCPAQDERQIVQWMTRMLPKRPWGECRSDDSQAFIVWGWKR